MVEPVELRPNRHPVDEMHDIKEAIERLQKHYDELRDRVIADPELRRGVRDLADKRRLDMKAVRKYFGMERLERFMVAAPQISVTLRKRAPQIRQ